MDIKCNSCRNYSSENNSWAPESSLHATKYNKNIYLVDWNKESYVSNPLIDYEEINENGVLRNSRNTPFTNIGKWTSNNKEGYVYRDYQMIQSKDLIVNSKNNSFTNTGNWTISNKEMYAIPRVDYDEINENGVLRNTRNTPFTNIGKWTSK